MKKNKTKHSPFKFIALFLIIASTLSAQEKQSSLSVNGGITGKKSYGFLLNYNYSSGNSNYEVGVVYSSFTNDKYLPIQYSSTTLQLGYFHTVFRNVNNSINGSIGAGLQGGFENIPSVDYAIIKSKNGLIYGGYAGAQIDFFLSDSFSLLIRGQENIYLKTTTGKTNPLLTLGVKFNL